jgi:hypothetical protein
MVAFAPQYGLDQSWTLDALGNNLAAGTYNAANEETPTVGSSGYCGGPDPLLENVIHGKLALPIWFAQSHLPQQHRPTPPHLRMLGHLKTNVIRRSYHCSEGPAGNMEPGFGHEELAARFQARTNLRQ